MRRVVRWLGGLTLAVLAITLVGAAVRGADRAQASSQAPAVHADSSAVVVLVDNRTVVPVEVFIKLNLAYQRLGECPPASHCLYVIPSVQLGDLRSFQVSGLAHGDTAPDDSPVLYRFPGRPSVMQYTISPPSGAAPEQA